MSVHPPAGAETESGASGPTVVETAEELIFLVDGVVVGATMMPGFLLCVPALALVLVPVVGMALVAAAVGLVILLVAHPVRVGWRVARRLRHRRAAGRAPRGRLLTQSPGGRAPATPASSPDPASLPRRA